MLQASEGGSKVLWVNLVSGIQLGNVSLERSDIGHLRNNRACWIFLFGKMGPFKTLRRDRGQAPREKPWTKAKSQKENGT